MNWLQKYLKVFANLDLLTIFIITALASYGVLMVFSATSGDVGYMDRKILQVALGLGVMLIVANIKYSYVQSLALPFLIFTVFLLVCTVLFGVTSKGATRWLNLGFTRFQPSEFAKLAVPIYLCSFLGQLDSKLSWPALIISGVAVAVPSALVLVQPDLGTTILVALSGLIVIFLAGLSWRIIILGVIFVLIMAPLFWEYGMHDYQRTRVLTILNPDSDPLGAGYHVNQSKIAIGSGGVSGKGILQGTQVQLNFLPEAHTDFIFSVLAEELGLFGVTVLFSLFFLLILRMFWLATIATNRMAKLLCASQGFIFSIYVIVNVGMVSGLLPVVGVPLPLVSYGGTSFITLCITFGLVMGVFKQTQREKNSFKNSVTG
ncbi:rod shape-determining protein RodA [Psittacicella hinzii]|uniref:Peptidoglycan glycosyltransferase MrdB n=1 Tax=Psittacicella hinzii TaxID=2028575 RepID=A0A3A1YSL9_9GAMM|nr:rod shape-determining protein RodA [Psittacicella hinzii]RIY39027.1 rod shape-determining protein RodA [Psittacicella hinzii]